MKRRELIVLLGSVAAVCALAGHAQQPERIRRLGVLIGFPAKDPFTQTFVTAFVQGLSRLGWVEGKNIRIDYRFAAGDPALYNSYAAELVGLTPDAILVSPGPLVAALRERTRTIPVVFVLLADPVGLGFVQSLARPGGNITGFSSFDAPLMEKWLQLLKEVAPGVTRVAVIFNPDTAISVNRAIEAAAPSLGMTVTLAGAHNDSEIEEAIAAQARSREAA